MPSTDFPVLQSLATQVPRFFGRLRPVLSMMPMVWWMAGAGVAAADFTDPAADREALPTVPPGFEISFFAREPLVRQPCSMAFDARGRLCVGMGPQYRNPKRDTPGDSVVLVLDEDGDGRAERTKVCATGFNAIQALAWRGRDLWVANAPDLTVVRDLDGDDEADEYVRVYTDLGNLEHGLHGLNWAPDGRLYMSKGNSKGLTEPGRIAPKPFRDLWGVSAPPGSPDFPSPRTYRKGEYRHAYHDPEDDWGREGGILRCDDGGRNLEIVARGFRNPWDITSDSGFNWLGTDNDQTSGDRVFMPFGGAHFGWNHPWSAQWADSVDSPAAPVSGPLFEGSGTGVVFGDSPQFPPSHRGVFFINDWLRKATFVWRPQWDGALLRPAGGDWEVFVQGGRALFRPTDLEVGPDGALWILGWSSGYGAEYKDGQMTSEGRVFRVTARGDTPVRWNGAKRSRALADWSTAELLEDFEGPLAVWRTDAQEELVRRGDGVKSELLAALGGRARSEARETWTAWTLGRIGLKDRTIDEWFAGRLADPSVSLNLRVQAVRILADRIVRTGRDRELPAGVPALLSDREPRLRFEAVQAVAAVRQRSAVAALLGLLAAERDRTTYYAGWQSLRRIEDEGGLRRVLSDSRPGVRRGALLALLEDHRLREGEVGPLTNDPDPAVRALAEQWVRKAAGGGEAVQVRGRPLDARGVVTADSSRSAGLVRNLQARSGARYVSVPGGLRPGARPYADRAYTLKSVPRNLVGADYIQTANDDDGGQGTNRLAFEALLPVRVLVALDTRTAVVPRWLRDGFRRSELRIEGDHWTFQLYAREFPAGRIELGGNTEDGRAGGKGNYLVILEALPLVAPPAATTIESVLGLLDRADADRGAALFHVPGAAGCYNCHRLDGHGNGFGPDLGTLGERATARHIVQSMLEPNAVITEGFNLQTVETAEEEYSGILIEESGLSLTLGLADGRRVAVPKSRITGRRVAKTSAMPAYDQVLTAGHAADLASYLQRQQLARPVSGAGTTRALEVALRDDRMVITQGGKPLGEYVFRDPKILRPYFANLHAPGGMRVTRNHPPVAGVDATDHDAMHPGVWIGFGDISGVDFWRNKGRVEQIRFSEAPRVREGSVRFATESRLRAPDGAELGGLEQRFLLRAIPQAWVLEWEAEFRAGPNGLVFGDQEEMGLGARVATSVTEKNGGRIRSSTGLSSARSTWGQPADWCDYSGTISGRPVGLTLMAHPGNFRGSWWHNRDYGVFVANPFGREAMKQGAKSRVEVKGGETLRLRFAAVIHDGAFDPAAVFTAYAQEAGGAR